MRAHPGTRGKMPRPMAGRVNTEAEIRKSLAYNDLPFRDFVELALFHPDFGYYTSRKPAADYITAPQISPVFAFAIGKLVRQFVDREEAGLSTVVDIGCGDGRLIHTLSTLVRDSAVRFYGVDRSLERLEVDANDRL